jgi:ribosome maturation factor RimP
VSAEESRDRLAGVLTAPLAEVGLDVEAVELTPAGKRRLLRVAVDKDGGVTMDDIADATREVSRVLDDTNAMGEQPYTLEVTSPGTDRPLTLPRHWRRSTGRLVKARLADGGELVGRIVAVGDDAVELQVDGTQRRLALDEVAKAVVQVEFNRPADAPTSDEG